MTFVRDGLPGDMLVSSKHNLVFTLEPDSYLPSGLLGSCPAHNKMWDAGSVVVNATLPVVRDSNDTDKVGIDN